MFAPTYTTIEEIAMDERQPPEPAGEEVSETYEPPAVEDLDSTFGPSVTAAGGGTVILAAPREL
jgi:hypothetical protein